MKVRSAALLFISTALLCSSLTANSATPPKPGGNCPKAGSTQTYKGMKYTCMKSGKKLIWSKGVTVAKEQPNLNATPTPSPVVSPTVNPIASPTPKPTPTPIIEVYGRAPYFYFSTSGSQVTLTIPQGEYGIYKFNGYTAKNFVSRAIDASGKEFIGNVGTIPISGDLRMNWNISYGDIWKFSIAPVDEKGRGLWSQPRTFSIQKRQEIASGNQNPIDGKYLLGDIGPASGRIYLLPDSAITHLKGYSVVGPNTPQGYYYEIATVDSFYGFGIPCWPGMNQRLEPISKRFSQSDGLLNTQLIIDSGLCTQTSIAYEVKALNILGYKDWFIPSANEIAPLYTISIPWSLWGQLSRTPEECILSTLSPFGAFYKVSFRGYTSSAGSYEGEVSGIKCAVRKFKF
jgi:hypothetical protein